VGGSSKASGERTSRGCDEGWDGGAIVDGQATIRWLGCHALGIVAGLPPTKHTLTQFQVAETGHLCNEPAMFAGGMGFYLVIKDTL
jgi:hypothetical protein